MRVLTAGLLVASIALTVAAAPISQTPGDQLSPRESEEVDQFVRGFNKRIARTHDLTPFLTEPLASKLLDKVLLDKDDVILPIDHRLVSQRNLFELRHFWIAMSNLAYLSDLYVYTRMSVNGVRTYELPPSKQYPRPVLRRLKRDSIMANWWRHRDSNSSSDKVVESIVQLRQLRRTFERAVILMRAYFRTHPPEHNSKYQQNLADLSRYLKVVNVSECDSKPDCAILPFHTKTVTVNVPVLTLMLAWIDGKLTVLTVGMVDD